MTSSVIAKHEIDVADIEYLRHGDKPLLARMYKPRGNGPFPLVIDLHGGAWINKDRLADKAMDEALAQSGVVVASLDFRMPPNGQYPDSMADINYAVRWFKSRAAEFRISADKVGLLGFSSGAHQGILAAMRPHDPRYAALPLAANPQVDATVRFVVLCSPLVDPLERFHYAKALQAAPGGSKFADRVLPGHDRYWHGEASMAEGNPVLVLERGEPVQTPPVLYESLSKDGSHPRVSLDRFIAGYRKAGGRVDLQWFDDESGDSFITGNPTTPAAIAAIAKVIEFVHRETR